MRPLLEEYKDRLRVEWKALPLEWVNGRPTPRDILDAEWWPAALHEPDARWTLYTADTYPDSTLPAFEAAKAAGMQGPDAYHTYDLLLREAYFGRSMDISKREVLLQLAGEAGLDIPRFERDLDSGRAAEMVRSDYEEGSEFLDPRGSPSFVLPDNSQVYNPAVAKLKFERGQITGVSAMPCYGEDCRQQYRALFDRAVRMA